MQFIKNRRLRIVLGTLSGLTLAIVTALILLQLPYVQTRLAQQAISYVEKITSFEVSLGSIEIEWLDEIRAHNIKLKDPESNDLVNCKSLKIDFDIISLLTEDDIHFNYLELENPKVSVVYLDSVGNLNLNIFLNSFKKGERKGTKPIEIDRVSIKNGSFSYFRKERIYPETTFDPYEFSLDSIRASLSDFRVIGPNVSLTAINLTAREIYSSLFISDLKTDFLLTPDSMVFDQLNLKTKYSEIKNKLILKYSSMAAFQYFVDSVDFSAELSNSTVHKKDLERFSPKKFNFPDEITVSSSVSGPVSNLSLENMLVTTQGNHSIIKGNASISGLPDIYDSFINLQLRDSKIDIVDVRQFYPKNLPGRLEEIGTVSLKADFLGYPKDFVAYGTFNTRLGEIQSDINLKVPDKRLPSYRGELKLLDFNLGYLTNNDEFSRITFDGKVHGKGNDLSNLNLIIDGKTDSIRIGDYTLNNIVTDAKIKESLFSGFVSVDDENLKMAVDGEVNLTAGRETIDIQGVLDTLNTAPFGLTEDNYFVKFNSKFNFEGLSADSIRGDAFFNNVKIKRDTLLVSLDSIELKSRRTPKRLITVKTPFVDAEFSGNYSARVISKEIIRLINEYKYILLNDTIKLAEYTERNSDIKDVFNLNFLVNIKHINPVFDLIGEPLYISDSTRIEGNYNSNITSIINLYSEFDTLRYSDLVFIDNILDLNTSVRNDTAQVLAMIYFESKKQITNNIESENIALETIWDNNTIDFNANLIQEKFRNSINFNGEINLGRGETHVKVLDSEIILIDEPWRVNNSNVITFRDSSVFINKFYIESSTSALKFDGQLSKHPEKILNIQFDDINIGILNSLIDKNISGNLNGFADLKNMYNSPKIENLIKIDGFAINEFPVGDLLGTTNWNKQFSRFDLDFKVTDKEILTMSLNGSFKPGEGTDALDLHAILNEAPINILEPFIGSYFSRLDGKAKGEFDIYGSIVNPQVDGNGTLQNGHLNINYLNASLDASGTFSFSEDKIYLDDIAIKDLNGNQGNIKGVINHGGFRRFGLDLKGTVNNIQILNTRSTDNSYFYGEGYGTGDFEIFGLTENLTINANLTSEKGTKIYIPIEGTEEIKKEDFISFTDFDAEEDKTLEEEIGKVDLNGIDLNLNLDINSNAYVEIIFDIKAGDIIRGRGNGDLNIDIDTQGEFNMFGGLTIEEGWYNFTLYNIINKEFIIKPGGTISWYGDPYGGIMDLEADYQQFASLAPLLRPEYASASELSRKFPASVNINLDGPLLNPEIDFGIGARNLPNNYPITTEDFSTSLDLELEFQTAKNSMDEQEIRRQAFSLIVLKRFSPPQSFNASGALTNSVSEMFSNQLSYWVSQVDSNLEVDFDFDLTQLDEEALNTFQLRLSYTFLDGRLRVSRDGNLATVENELDLVGDWSVEYLLTEDGRLKVRMYSKSNFDAYNQYSNAGNSYTTGVSFQYTQNFDEFFNEMARILRIKDKEKEKENDPEPNSSKESNTEARKNEEDEDN